MTGKLLLNFLSKEAFYYFFPTLKQRNAQKWYYARLANKQISNLKYYRLGTSYHGYNQFSRRPVVHGSLQKLQPKKVKWNWIKSTNASLNPWLGDDHRESFQIARIIQWTAWVRWMCYSRTFVIRREDEKKLCIYKHTSVKRFHHF